MPRAASTITDQIDGGDYDVRIAFHLGPEVEAELDGSHAVLRWPTAATPGEARLALPPQLRWSLHRGETDPILGWYSPGLGQRVPAFTLLGCGRSARRASRSHPAGVPRRRQNGRTDRLPGQLYTAGRAFFVKAMPEI